MSYDFDNFKKKYVLKDNDKKYLTKKHLDDYNDSLKEFEPFKPDNIQRENIAENYKLKNKYKALNKLAGVAREAAEKANDKIINSLMEEESVPLTEDELEEERRQKILSDGGRRFRKRSKKLRRKRTSKKRRKSKRRKSRRSRR